MQTQRTKPGRCSKRAGIEMETRSAICLLPQRHPVLFTLRQQRYEPISLPSELDELHLRKRLARLLRRHMRFVRSLRPKLACLRSLEIFVQLQYPGLESSSPVSAVIRVFFGEPIMCLVGRDRFAAESIANARPVCDPEGRESTP